MSDVVCAIVDPSGAFVLRADLRSLARLSIDRVAPRDATGMLGALVCGRRVWCACQRRPGHHGYMYDCDPVAVAYIQSFYAIN